MIEGLRCFLVRAEGSESRDSMSGCGFKVLVKCSCASAVHVHAEFEDGRSLHGLRHCDSASAAILSRSVSGIGA